MVPKMTSKSVACCWPGTRLRSLDRQYEASAALFFCLLRLGTIVVLFAMHIVMIQLLSPLLFWKLMLMLVCPHVCATVNHVFTTPE